MQFSCHYFILKPIQIFILLFVFNSHVGQKLEDMDISVHCDITIFDWLMRWVKKGSLPEDSWPKLGNYLPFLFYLFRRSLCVNICQLT
jgi:hypothetical protein